MLWFRLYSEMVDDPKVGMLNDCEFRVFIEAMCIASKLGKEGATGCNAEQLNWAIRRPVTDAVTSLLQKRFLSEKPCGEIYVTNWNKWQRKSDDSKPRVDKYRGKQPCNGSVTDESRYSNALDTDTDKNRGEKKRKEKKIDSGSGEPAAKKDFIPSIKAMDCYRTLNIDLELSKMQGWLAVNPSRKLTKRFVVGWLNRALNAQQFDAAIEMPKAAPIIRKQDVETLPDPDAGMTTYEIIMRNKARKEAEEEAARVQWV